MKPALPGNWCWTVTSHWKKKKKTTGFTSVKQCYYPNPTHFAIYLVWIIILATSQNFGSKSSSTFQWILDQIRMELSDNDSELGVGSLLVEHFPNMLKALSWITSSGSKQKTQEENNSNRKWMECLSLIFLEWVCHYLFRKSENG